MWGLLGGVFDDGHAVGQGGGQHDVHGSAHGDDIQVDLGARHPPVGGPGVDIAAPHVHVGPHGHKALDVLVDGPAAEITAAGRGDFRRAEAAQQGADQVVGGADLSGQLLRHPGVADVGAIHIHRGAVDGAHIGPQLLQDVEQQRHVADLRQVFNAAHPVHQQGGGDNGHGSVFCAADIDFSIKRLPAVNHILCQNTTLYSFHRGIIRTGGIQGRLTGAVSR